MRVFTVFSLKSRLSLIILARRRKTIAVSAFGAIRIVPSEGARGEKERLKGFPQVTIDVAQVPQIGGILSH